MVLEAGHRCRHTLRELIRLQLFILEIVPVLYRE